MLASPLSGKGDAAREAWKKQFAAGAAEREGKEPGSKPTGEEHGPAQPQARRITGLGEQAFWQASRVGGALYVFQGDSFFV